MVDETAPAADNAPFADLARWGVGRAAIVAAVVSALVMVGLVEAGFGLGARAGTPFVLLLLALAIVPGICAGLVGNVGGSVVGTFVGVAIAGWWVVYRFVQPQGSMLEEVDALGLPRHFFGAFLNWMSGGPLPDTMDLMEIYWDPLRVTFWTMIVISTSLNVTAAIVTAILARPYYQRRSLPSLLAREWAAAESSPPPPRSTP